MKEAVGNIWDIDFEYRCVTTNSVVMNNGRLVMGGGIAREARDRFPGIDMKLGQWVLKYGNRPFLCRNEKIISFPTKFDWRADSTPELICYSVNLTVQLADKFGIKSIGLPRPGCGLGGLRWEDVRPLLADSLDDRFTVVTF